MVFQDFFLLLIDLFIYLQYYHVNWDNYGAHTKKFVCPETISSNILRFSLYLSEYIDLCAIADR